ncbi:MAG: radical SAM protein [Candidatus Hodarchaeaceae archaeon]|nr:radical SAM protein [Candidatus Hodarchaeaceae archaeon]
MKNDMITMYGPVSSWRLGRSLGVDLICQEKGKVCSFDCVYCSLGKTTELATRRRVFVPTVLVARELKKVMKKVEADVVTFSGTGEPTLAQNLGEAIKVAKEISGLPIAVLTNSSLMVKEEVRMDLTQADIVIGELDAPNEEVFKRINQPHEGLLLADTIQGMKKFRREFKGKFALEIMFVSENKPFSQELAAIARAIDPDEVQINTPLRPSPIRPLTPEELKEIQRDFEGMNFLSVYEAKKPEVKKAVGLKKLQVLKRVE